MFVVGLTGGIGSGKTAASDRFADLGIKVVDADIASRVVVEPGRPALDHIRDHFGDDMILPDGNMDRAKMREKVFANPDERKWLESLLHPLINAEIAQGIASASSPYVILAHPLLIETNQSQICNRVLLIDVPVEVQVQRTMERDDNSEEQVRAIIAAQTDRETRLENADDVVVNDCDLSTLHERIDALHETYRQMAANPG